MTTTHSNPPGGWTATDKVRPAISPSVLMAEAPIVVRFTRIDGRTFTYRLTRMIVRERFTTLAGIRINKAGKVVGNGRVSLIGDVFESDIVADRVKVEVL